MRTSTELERSMERVHVDDVEASDGDALEQDGADVLPELAALDELDHARRGVRAVATHDAGDDAVEPRARADGADEPDVSAAALVERRIVEADHVAERARQGEASVHGAPGRTSARAEARLSAPA
jgi:hypothetical protein